MDQSKLLFDILGKNSDTDFGKRYAFRNIRTVQAFQNSVPVTDYESYAPMIELMTRLGEYGIFTPHDLECYTSFLGTNWKLEKIPCTKEYSQLCFEAMSDLLTGREKNIILFSSIPKTNPGRDGLYTNSIYGIILEKWREWRSHNFAAKLLGYGQSVLPDELLFPDDTEEYTYAKALIALSAEDATQIVAQNTWSVLDFITFIISHWNELLNDMENGTISDSNINDELRSKLFVYMNKNPKRASALRKLEEPYNIKSIWPGLKRIVADGSGRMEIYTKQVLEFAPDIELDFGCSFSAESIYAKNIPGTNTYSLLECMNFYEFLPVEKMWDSHIEEFLILPDQLENGKSYEMFVTTPYGFYRYRLGEVIRVTECTQDAVIFTREYNFTDVVRFMDSYITQNQFSAAVLELEDRTGMHVEDFFCLPEGNSILFLLESEKRTGYSSEEIETILDTSLQELSKKYLTLRKNGECDRVHIQWLQPQTQMLLRDLCRFKKIIPNDLYRPVRCPSEPWLVDLILTLTDNF